MIVLRTKLSSRTTVISSLDFCFIYSELVGRVAEGGLAHMDSLGR